MRILILPIKKNWYTLIDHEEKLDEYRALTPYYLRRIFWSGSYDFTNGVAEQIIQDFKDMDYDKVVKKWRLIVKIDFVKFINGYGAKRPNFMTKLRGVKVGTGRREWGAKKGVKYFVLSISRTWAKKIDKNIF